jgi:O-antigen ligase
LSAAREAPRSAALPILALAIVGSALVLSTRIASFSDVPKRSVVQLGVALALLCALALRGGPARRLPAEVWPALGGWLLASWAALRAADAFLALETWLHWSFAGLAYLTVTRFVDARGARSLLCAFAGSGVAIALIGFAHYLGWVGWDAQLGVASSTFGNRNWAGEALVMCLPALGASWLLSSAGRSSWALSLGSAAVLAFLLKINSSAAYFAVIGEFALAAGLLLAGAAHRRELGVMLRARKGPVLCAAALFAALAVLGPDGLEDPTRGLARELASLSEGLEAGRSFSADAGRVVQSTVAARLGVSRVALAMIAERPLLGGGLGHFAAAFPEVNRRLGWPAVQVMHIEQRHAHDDWLQACAEIGLLGLALLGAWCALWLRRAWSLQRGRGAADEPAVIARAAALALTGFALTALFAYPAFNAVPPFYAATFAGLLGVASPASRAPSMGRRPRLAAAALLSLAIAALVAWRAAVWSSEYHHARLLGALGGGEWAQVEERARAMEGAGTGRLDHLPYWAQARLVAGDGRTALRLLERLLRAYPFHPAGTALMGAALKVTGEPDRALQALVRAIDLAPWEHELYRQAASLLVAQGRREDAAALLQRGLAFDDGPQLREIGRDLGLDAPR